MTNEMLLVVFVAMTGLALAVQAIVVVAFYFFAKNIYGQVRQDLGELRESAVPFLKTAKEILAQVMPQIEPVTTDVVKAAASMRAISADVADISAKVRTQVDGAQASTTEIVERARFQAARLDAIITATLDGFDRIGVFLQSAVGTPARQIAGILAAAKAIMESLRTPAPAASRAPAANDNETFI